LDENRIKYILKAKLDNSRFIHTLSVQKLAVKLAQKYKIDVNKARLASLLHDCAKWMSPQQLLLAVENYQIELDEIDLQIIPVLHSIVGAYWAKETFHINDEEILRAIMLHTTGDEYMSLLDQVIYVADYAEPTREYNGAKQIYKLAFENLDKATLEVANKKILYLIETQKFIHPKTIKMRNFILKEKVL